MTSTDTDEPRAAEGEHAPPPPRGLLDSFADAFAGGADLRFGHLIPLSARAPSPAYLRSLEHPFWLDDDEEEEHEGLAADEAAAAADEEAAIRARSHRRDTIVTTAVGLGTYGLSIFTGPLLARALSPDERGTYAAVWAPTQILGWLLMLGIPAASTYYARRDNRRQLETTGWLLTAVIGLPIFALLWPLVPLFLHKHPPMAVMWFRLFLGAMLLVLPMQNCFEYLRARGGNTKFNIYRSLPLLLTTVFIVALFVSDSLTLRNGLLATFLANLLGAVAVIGIEGSWPRFGRDTFDWRLTKLQLSYGGRVWVGTLSNMVLARFDQMLMVSIVASDQLAYYAIAVTVAGLSAPVAQGVGFALLPFLLRDDDPHSRSSRMWQGFQWVLIGSIVICGGLALIAPWGLPALMGAEYRASLPAFYVLLPGQLVWNLGLVFKTRLEADNRPGAGSNALAISAVVTLVGVPALVPMFGIMGAAVVTTVSQAMFTGLGYVFVRRGLRQDLAALAVAEAAAFDAEIDRELQPASAGNGEEER
ncbi:MAG: oligosaccharide flippase family protein [Acidimicrobiales bacterium]|nr:oligosaccharide flippase family protein [Acidimicrobiales bacterium]